MHSTDLQLWRSNAENHQYWAISGAPNLLGSRSARLLSVTPFQPHA